MMSNADDGHQQKPGVVSRLLSYIPGWIQAVIVMMVAAYIFNLATMIPLWWILKEIAATPAIKPIQYQQMEQSQANTDNTNKTHSGCRQIGNDRIIQDGWCDVIAKSSKSDGCSDYPISRIKDVIGEHSTSEIYQQHSESRVVDRVKICPTTSDPVTVYFGGK